jgi:hypothetical protein
VFRFFGWIWLDLAGFGWWVQKKVVLPGFTWFYPERAGWIRLGGDRIGFLGRGLPGQIIQRQVEFEAVEQYGHSLAILAAAKKPGPVLIVRWRKTFFHGDFF